MKEEYQAPHKEKTNFWIILFNPLKYLKWKSDFNKLNHYDCIESFRWRLEN